MKWKVVVDIFPRMIEGTNGCHKYVHSWHDTKKEADNIAAQINENGKLGKATVERVKR